MGGDDDDDFEDGDDDDGEDDGGDDGDEEGGDCSRLKLRSR